MLKAVENIMESQSNRKFGNHSVVWQASLHGEMIQYCKYHGNTVCTINWTKNTAVLTNAGWNTPSTNRTLNDYKRYLEMWLPEIKVMDTRDVA